MQIFGGWRSTEMFSSSLLSVQREETAGEFLEQLLHLPEQITLSILAHLLRSKVPCPAINQDILIPSLSWFLINFMRKIQKDKEEENQNWWGRGTVFFFLFSKLLSSTSLLTHLPPDPPIPRPESQGQCLCPWKQTCVPSARGFCLWITSWCHSRYFLCVC